MIMPPIETPLEMARRHVVEGEERCARQATLIRRMAADGLDTLEAEGLLAQFEGFLELSRNHLRRLEAEAG